MRCFLRSRPAARRGALMLGCALLAMPAMPGPAMAARSALAQSEAPALAPDPVPGPDSSPAPSPAPDPAHATSDAAAPMMSSSGLRTRLGRQQAEALEAHITTLHRSWHITPAQEPLWNRLTGTMRQGAVQIDAEYARREQRGSMSARDDLQSYAMVQQTHAANAQALLAPFASLYDSFSPAQRRLADETVRRFTENALRTSR